MKIRAQHYVWDYYLRAWGADGRIFCRRSGRIFPVSSKKVAKERDFYAVPNFTTKDLLFIEHLIINTAPEALRKGHREILHSFATVSFLHNAASVSANISADVRAALEEAKINSGELLHGNIERRAQGYLDLLKAGDTTFFSELPDACGFFRFLCVQYFRTKRMREKMKGNAGRFAAKHFDVDMDKLWTVMSYMFATNTSYSMFMGRTYSLTLLQNDTHKSFITSDQPAINTLSFSEDVPPDELEIFYPVSPTTAVLLSERENMRNSSKKWVSATEVHHYNSLIMQHSHDSIFGDSESALKELG